MSDILIHYGVKGMKWGVRRYQNYDGTRIGTGGEPVTNTAKQINEKFKKSIAGGQSGSAVGNARLAANTTIGNRESKKAKEVKAIRSEYDEAVKKASAAQEEYYKKLEEYTAPLGEYKGENPEKWLDARDKAAKETNIIELNEKAIQLQFKMEKEWSKLSYNDLDDELVKMGSEYPTLALWEKKVNLFGKPVGESRLVSINKNVDVFADPVTQKRTARLKKR